MPKTARIMAVAAVVMCAACAFGSMQDKLARFSTPGPDRYADGSIVVDGECYALVWSPAGTAFAGFNADGTPVSSRDRVVLAGALAQDGKCRDAVFQIPAAEYEALKGGEWAVCLVDTRNLAGVPTGVRNGKPLRVNRWGIVSGGVNITDASSTKPRLAATGGTRSVASDGGRGATALPVRANRLSAVPSNLLPPQITAIEVARLTAPCRTSTTRSSRARRRTTSSRITSRRSSKVTAGPRSRLARYSPPSVASSR